MSVNRKNINVYGIGFYLVDHPAFKRPQLVKAKSRTEAESLFRQYYDDDYDVYPYEIDGVMKVKDLSLLKDYEDYLDEDDD